ncbi:MAG: hypothetical protein Q9214_003526, partial [Letrouitia sp. 1 TL-2023]
DTWKMSNKTLTQADYLDLLDQLMAAFQTNDTSLADIKPDSSNSKAINDLSLYGPNESDLAWWLGDEEADSFMFRTSTSGALNLTSSSSKLTFSDLNSTYLGSSPSPLSNLTASPRVQQKESTSTTKRILPMDSRAEVE